MAGLELGRLMGPIFTGHACSLRSGPHNKGPRRVGLARDRRWADAQKSNVHEPLTADAEESDGKPHRVGYVGRFRIANVRLDDAGLHLELVEQVARAVNPLPVNGRKARRGRGSY
jgi:hypothetical protein